MDSDYDIHMLFWIWKDILVRVINHNLFLHLIYNMNNKFTQLTIMWFSCLWNDYIKSSHKPLEIYWIKHIFNSNNENF